MMAAGGAHQPASAPLSRPLLRAEGVGCNGRRRLVRSLSFSRSLAHSFVRAASRKAVPGHRQRVGGGENLEKGRFKYQASRLRGGSLSCITTLRAQSVLHPRATVCESIKCLRTHGRGLPAAPERRLFYMRRNDTARPDAYRSPRARRFGPTRKTSGNERLLGLFLNSIEPGTSSRAAGFPCPLLRNLYSRSGNGVGSLVLCSTPTMQVLFVNSWAISC
jgi:hypothetical protein